MVMILEGIDRQIDSRRHKAFLDAHAELGISCDELQLKLAGEDWDATDVAKFDSEQVIHFTSIRS